MVSGRLEKNETAWQAAVREIREETGLVPDTMYSSNKIEAFYEGNQNCINLVPVFVAFVNRESAEVTLSNSEHDDYKWVTAEEALDYLIWENHMELIKHIETQFIAKKPNPYLRVEI